jgi:dihydroorotase
MALARVIELFTARPARVLSNTEVGQRGTLRVGTPADIAIFDSGAKCKYEAAQSKSKSHNTPFDGWELQGTVVAAIVSGRVVLRES